MHINLELQKIHQTSDVSETIAAEHATDSFGRVTYSSSTRHLSLVLGLMHVCVIQKFVQEYMIIIRSWNHTLFYTYFHEQIVLRPTREGFRL